MNQKSGYASFRLVLSHAVGRRYWSHVSASSVGQGYGKLKVPRSAQFWEQVRTDLARASRAPSLEESASRTSAFSLKQVGHELFKALLPKDLANMFSQSKVIASRTNSSFRFRIGLRGKTASKAPLYALPWELLFERDMGFLCLDQAVSLIRQVEVKHPTAKRRLPPRPHVLIIGANPASEPQLNLAKELNAIEKLWKDNGRGTVQVLPRVTVGGLYEAVRSRPVHIIHYMGHADREGRILLEDGDTSFPDRVTAESLTRLLTHIDSLFFVFLNACYTATPATSADPFSTMGPAISLAVAGVPNVLAMQFPIADDVAAVFGESIHRELIAGASIESAVVSGRNLLASKWRESSAWATPVLFEGEQHLAHVVGAFRGEREFEIGGRWFAEIEYPNSTQGKEASATLDKLRNRFVMDLRYNEGRWIGDIDCIQGYSESFVYELDGLYEDNIFSGTYRVGNKPSQRRGALVLKVKEQGTDPYLKGWTTYWDVGLDEILSAECRWYRQPPWRVDD